MRLPSPYRVIATVVHSVVDEYRKLEPQPAKPTRQEMSCTSAHIQAHTAEPPDPGYTRRVGRPFATGFGLPTRGEDD